jgi:hypothetical protein
MQTTAPSATGSPRFTATRLIAPGRVAAQLEGSRHRLWVQTQPPTPPPSDQFSKDGVTARYAACGSARAPTFSVTKPRDYPSSRILCTLAIKRHIYGHAEFDLLHKRVLLAARRTGNSITESGPDPEFGCR